MYDNHFVLHIPELQNGCLLMRLTIVDSLSLSLSAELIDRRNNSALQVPPDHHTLLPPSSCPSALNMADSSSPKPVSVLFVCLGNICASSQPYSTTHTPS